MAKTTEKTLERTYNVPLRKEYMKAPRWNRTKKAVTALRQFLAKHMKSENVLLSKELNEELWKHGIQNPPHHIKVKAVKDDKGVVKAEWVGKEKPASKKNKAEKKETKTVKEPTKAKEVSQKA
ncbi:MAG: 50S ribosomal protein L31e [Nanoarchaeota archaeon]|nr:50S ribosomal protein L31e [Nanoarchaeota archaeon]